MQIAAGQLPNQLQRGLASLYTLHGDEPLLIQEGADAIRAAARAAGYTERTSHTVARLSLLAKAAISSSRHRRKRSPGREYSAGRFAGPT